MSAKKFRLPEVLGGGEILADESWAGCAGGRPEYYLGEGFTLLAPEGKPLNRVPPPIPDEPDNGVYLIGEFVARRLSVSPDDTERWAAVGVDEWLEWPTVWRRFGGPDVEIVPLVPECGCCDGHCETARTAR